MAFVKIENKEVGVGKPTYVVAEAGLNHNGDIHIAKKQVDKAVECGADAIKFQTYKTEEFLTYNCGYFDNFKKAELSYEEFGELKDYSKNKGITFFSAPFDIESADYLDKIGVPCFKIASSDLTNIPLIKNIAKKGKPMIISTGVANLSEVENTINFCTSQNNRDIILLHCVANYPTQPTEANLSVMNTMRQKFNIPIGYSDNGESTLVDIAAVCMGANLIEKHFTLDKKMKGPDHFFSIEPENFKNLISQIRTIEKMKGDGEKKPQPSELLLIKQIRKSLTAKTDIKKGQILTKENMSVKRPAEGIEPKYFDDLIGKKINLDIKKDTPIKFEYIS